MKSTNKIGLHFRLFDSYSNIAIKARTLGLTTIQIFALPKSGKKYLKPEGDDLKKFLEIRNCFENVYIHSSFKINLASGNEKLQQLSEYLFKKEIEIAGILQADAIVMHGGYANGYKTHRSKKDQQIKKSLTFFMNVLNKLFEEAPQSKLLLENSAQGNMTLASKLEDFVEIRNLISNGNIKFCLDTAHAFEYGYNLSNTEEFVNLLDRTMGIENINLIHFNDAGKKQGSKIDSHAPPGRGEIGRESLQNLIKHPRIKDIPKIIELPASKDSIAKEVLEDVNSW